MKRKEGEEQKLGTIPPLGDCGLKRGAEAQKQLGKAERDEPSGGLCSININFVSNNQRKE